MMKGFARRVQTVEDRRRPRANTRMSEMQSDLEPCSICKWKGHDVHASAQGVKRIVEAVLQRVSVRSMDMNSIVTNEQCRQIIQSVLKELGFDDRNYFVEDSTRYGLNQGYVLELTTMNLSGDLVQSKCEMMLKQMSCASH